jgi:hypothetical protein
MIYSLGKYVPGAGTAVVRLTRERKRTLGTAVTSGVTQSIKRWVFVVLSLGSRDGYGVHSDVNSCKHSNPYNLGYARMLLQVFG